MLHKTNHYATLDGLRGIAAIAVLLRHIYEALNIEHLSPHSYLAVDFFFMLSGFVVAKAYEARLSTSLTFVEFVKVRFVRLYPMIFVGALLGAGVFGVWLVTTHSLTAGNLLVASLSALVLLPTTALFSFSLSSVYFGMLYPVNPPEWSLFFEFVANVIYAPIVRWLSTKRLAIICGVSCIALILVVQSYDGVDVGPLAEDFFPGFIRVAFPFFLGVLLFRYRPAYRLKWFTGLFLGLLLGVVLLAPIPKEYWVYDCIAVIALFPPIVFLGSLCEGRPMLTAVWLWLGELSYPLYITHRPMVRLIKNAGGILHLHFNVALTFGACLVGSVVAAQLFLVVWDRPIRKWLSGRLLRDRLLPASSGLLATPSANPAQARGHAPN